MTLFRILSAIVIIGLAGAILYDLRRQKSGWRDVWKFFKTQTGIALHLWRERRRLAPGSTLDNLRRTAYGLSVAFLVLLGLTGFLPVLILGDRPSDTLLIVHVTVAPFLALCLCALALLWAHRLRFDEEDWHFVLEPAHRKASRIERRIRLALKVGFWLVLLFSLPLMGSIILSLFPLFGTEGETLLIRVHGYSALLFLIASIVEIHLTIAYVQQISQKTSGEIPS